MSTITHLLHPLLRRPLLLLTLLWAGGILLAHHLLLPWGSWTVAAVLLLVGWLVMARWGGAAPRLALALAVCCLAAGICTWQTPTPAPGDPRFLPADRAMMLIGYPLDAAVPTPTGWRAPFRLLQRGDLRRGEPADGDLYLTGADAPPEPGRQYLLIGRVLPPDEPGNPFGMSWQAYLNQHGYSYAVRAYRLERLSTPAPVSRVRALRAALAARLTAVMPVAYGRLYAQILDGLLLGAHGVALPAPLLEQFRRAGTIHLMIVSGSQITLLCGFLLYPLGLLPRGGARTTYPRLRVILLLCSLPLLGGYVLLADRGASVDRAVLMGVLSMMALFLAFSPLARTRAFRVDALTLLAVSALGIMIGRPLLLFSPSMQLSFAAVLGLCTVTPVLLRLLRGWPGWVRVPLAATVGAQSLACPVLAWHFGVVPVLAPLTNLLAMPAVGLLLPLGLLALLCASLAPPLAVLLNHLTAPLIGSLLWVSAVAAGVPWAEWRWVLHAPWGAALYLAGLAVGVRCLSLWLDTRDTDATIWEGRAPMMW